MTDTRATASRAASNFTDPLLAGVVVRLRRARRRFAYSTVVNLGLASVVIALAVFCLLQLADDLLGDLAPFLTFSGLFVPEWMADWRPSPFPQHLLLAAGAGLAAIAFVPVIAVLRHPGVAFMARAADRRFATGDCMSTALEVSWAPARWPGIVSQALLRYAGARSDLVDPRRLAPMRLSRFAAGVPILLVAALLLTLAPPPPLLQNAYDALLPVAVETPSRTQEQQDKSAANLRVIAAILKQDGEARADPAIQAIAHALDQLGNEVARDNGLDEQELAQELGRLLTLARDAYARAGEKDTSRNLARLIAGLNELAPNRPTGAYQDVPFNAGGGEHPEQPVIEDNPLTALLTTREYVGIEDFADLVPPGTVLGDPRTDRDLGGEGPADALAEEDLTRTYDLVDPDYGPEGPNTNGPAAGVLIGAGDGEGEGDYAGIGERSPFGPGGAPGAPIDVAGEMLLKNPVRGGGRRIRFDFPPQAALHAPDGNVPGDAGGWRTIAEGEVTRVDLPAPARDVVSRYFEAMRLGSAE